MNFLEFLLWLTISFTAMDYTLGRATVKDPLRAVLAAVFAVLVVLFVGGLATRF